MQFSKLDSRLRYSCDKYGQSYRRPLDDESTVLLVTVTAKMAVWSACDTRAAELHRPTDSCVDRLITRSRKSAHFAKLSRKKVLP